MGVVYESPGVWLSLPGVLVAQWLECPAGMWEAIVLIIVGDSDFFFVVFSHAHENEKFYLY